MTDAADSQVESSYWLAICALFDGSQLDLREVFEESSLYPLFELTKKRDVVQYAKTVHANDYDLIALILLFEHPGTNYSHVIHHRQLLPDALVITREDMAVFGSGIEVGTFIQGDALKVFNRVKHAFSDRRMLVGHMFKEIKGDRWHFFYFDQRDIQTDQNHWRYGTHIHFINYLWPGITAEGVIETFKSEDPKVRGAVHIRYKNASSSQQSSEVLSNPDNDDLKNGSAMNTLNE